MDASVVANVHYADWPAMELTYRLTRDDHLQCCKLIRERVAPLAPGLRGRKRTTALVIVWLALVLLILAVLASGVIDEHTFWVASIAYFD